VRLGRKLTLGVLALVVPPTAAAGATVVLLYRRGELPEGPILLGGALVGLVAAMLYVAVLAHRLGGSVVRSIETIHHGVELLGTVHPGHRLDVRNGDEREALAQEINRLADRLHEAMQGIDARVVAATRTLDLERRRLAGMIAELAEGVVVTSTDGRVTLANRAATDLLSHGHALLGRPLGELVDRGTLDRHLKELSNRGRAPQRFTVATVRGAALEVAMSPLPDEEGGTSGTILVLRTPSPALAGPAAALPSGPPGRPVGAGLHSGTASAAPGPLRSELYDFSLFDEMEPSVLPADRTRRLDEITFVVFDTETTGLLPEAGDRVISLAAVRVRGGQVRRGEAFDALVQPERPIPSESVKFHGITDAMVDGAPTIDLVLPAFLRFAGEAVLVGHEASFDLRFLEPEVRRLGLPSLTARPILDTRLLSRSLHGPAEGHTLEAIAARLGVTVTGRHSALGDALTTAEILVRLVALLGNRGVRTLGEALEAVRGARRVTV
jgi:DNA polymerase III epsilon subunit family exonuclease